MQREETILLKTSDGSIEVSCTYIQIYMKTKFFGLLFSATIKYKKDGKKKNKKLGNKTKWSVNLHSSIWL